MNQEKYCSPSQTRFKSFHQET